LSEDKIPFFCFVPDVDVVVVECLGVEGEEVVASFGGAENVQ